MAFGRVRGRFHEEKGPEDANAAEMRAAAVKAWNFVYEDIVRQSIVIICKAAGRNLRARSAGQEGNGPSPPAKDRERGSKGTRNQRVPVEREPALGQIKGLTGEEAA